MPLVPLLGLRGSDWGTIEVERGRDWGAIEVERGRDWGAIEVERGRDCGVIEVERGRLLAGVAGRGVPGVAFGREAFSRWRVLIGNFVLCYNV